jgi:hypothetical protein
MAGRETQSEASTSRARATPEEIVTAIVERMQQFAWVKGKTEKEFAEHYGLSRSRIRNLSAEASRIVRGAVPSREDVRAILFDQLRELVEDCKQQHPAVAVKALGEMADLLGLKKSGVELTGKDGAPVIPGVVVLPPESPVDEEDDTEPKRDSVEGEPWATD